MKYYKYHHGWVVFLLISIPSITMAGFLDDLAEGIKKALVRPPECNVQATPLATQQTVTVPIGVGIYKGPGQNCGLYGTTGKNVPVTIVGTSGNWYLFNATDQTGNRSSAWLSKDSVNLAKSPKYQPQNNTSRKTPAYPKELVAEVQYSLNAKGYDAGPVDGIYGRGTRNALIQYQRDAGLSQSGEPDEETLVMLEKGISNDATASESKSQFTNVKETELAASDNLDAPASGAKPNISKRNETNIEKSSAGNIKTNSKLADAAANNITNNTDKHDYIIGKPECGIVHEVSVYVPNNFDVLNDDRIKKYLDYGLEDITNVCSPWKAYVWLHYKSNMGSHSFSKNSLAWGSYRLTKAGSNNYYLENYENMERERREKKAKEAAKIQKRNLEDQKRRKPLLSFFSSTEADQIFDGESLVANPFVHEGKVGVLEAKFISMISKNEALFTTINGKEAFIVNKVPTTRFTKEERLLLACRVKGKEMKKVLSDESLLMTVVTYIDTYNTSKYKKSDLQWAIAEISGK